MSKLLDSKICSMSYSNNVSVGTATVTLRGRGKYYGSKTMSFTIVPEETPLRKPTSDVDSITVKWKKQSKRMKKTRITGYQIQYSTSKSFASGNKKTTVKGYSNTSKVIKNLKSGKKYYIRIRTYKTVNDKKYYSYWSEPRSIRTKTE